MDTFMCSCIYQKSRTKRISVYARKKAAVHLTGPHALAVSCAIISTRISVCV